MTFHVITTNFHGENLEILTFTSESDLKEFLIAEIEKLLHKSIIYNSTILQYNESIYKEKSLEELLDILKNLCHVRKKNFDIFARFISAIFNGELIYQL